VFTSGEERVRFDTFRKEETKMKTKKRNATKKIKKTAKPKRAQVRSKAIAEGTRLFALAGRPTKAQFVKVYGVKGPTMTWTQRAAAGVPASKFQAVLAEKSKA
jgi:hypothetical protein